MANAQAYKPFPTSDAMWREVRFELMLEGYCEDYQFLITGDTIINGMMYHKLQRTGYVGTHNAGKITHIDFFNEYAGCFRNDTLGKKVWCIFPDKGFERLLYDFNLQKGDSLYAIDGYVGIVTNIDTLSLSDGLHKRFSIFCPDIPSELPFKYYEIIEGIGSTIGLSHRMYNRSILTLTELMCVLINEKTIYSVESGDCIPTNAIEDYSQDKTRITLYPNPTNTAFQIKGIDDFQNISICIYNIYGQLIMQEQKLSKDEMIHIEALCKGC